MSPSSYQNLVDAYTILREAMQNILEMPIGPACCDHMREIAGKSIQAADHISHQVTTP